MSILGTAMPAANALGTLYTVPAGKRAVVNVSLCNRGVQTKVSLAVTASATPQDSEYIEFACPLPTSEVLERTALSLAAGQKVVAMSTTGTVACNVWGIEEVA